MANTYSKYCPNVFLAKCGEKHEKGEIITLTTRYGKENEVEVWNLVYERDGFFFYSFTRVDGYNRQERARARAEKYKEWAAGAREKASEAFEASDNAVKGIVPGQPILVGHHSEKKHRAAIEKSWNAIGRGVALDKKAEGHDSKANYWEGQAEKIDLSMPESIEYYQHKLEEAKEYHEGVKSGKYQREHTYTLTYAKKAVNEAQKNLDIAIKLWGC